MPPTRRRLPKIWTVGKWTNKHLGLPKRVAPGIRLHRKAEKSVHFLLRWLGTPSAKMKSIRETRLIPILSTFLKYAFSGSLQPSERGNWDGRPPRHNNFGRCGSIGGWIKGEGLSLAPFGGGGNHLLPERSAAERPRAERQRSEKIFEF